MPTPHAAAQTLRDIKPPVAIDDWSLYLYWGLVVFALLILGMTLYVLVRMLLKLRRTNRRREILSALKEIGWNNPKQSAYDATRLGRMMLSGEERLNELYRQMVAELEAYKYKKEVDPLSSTAKAQFDLFVKACDESL